jgi:UDP-GlcNAc:undecaprenyl-phosphate/decaprenyl-phosphate GlcNAc-1-phosphate transferase
VATSVFGVYFFMADLLPYSMLSFAMAASLVAFLYFNYHPARIFMGDSGSLLLGMVNAILVIKFISAADAKGVVLPLTSSVAIGFSILIVPLLDTLRVFSIRIYNGRSPFSPDRNHIHHLLLDMGLNHSNVTIACVLLNIVFIALAFLGRSIGSTLLLGSMIVSWFALIGAVIYLWKPLPQLVIVQKDNDQIHQSSTKVVSIANEAAVAGQ